jgi:DNA repair protein RecN (Recombination protein N)
VLSAHGLPADGGAVLLSRSVPAGGRGRCFVQAELTTQQALGAVGSELVDICSQHEHHSLTQVPQHATLLDAYAELDAELATYQERWRELGELRRSANELRERAGEASTRADYLRYQLEELERVAPAPGERDEVEGRVSLLRDARTWAAFARDASDALYDGERAVVGKLAHLFERARRGAPHSPRLADIAAQLEAARIACDEASQLVARFVREIDFEPGELERAEERLAELDGLRKKHGVPFEDLAARAVALRAELEALDNVDERLSQLEARDAGLAAECLEIAQRLSTARRSAAQSLGRALEVELAALHLPRARLEARVESLPDGELGPRGLDRVELLFSANAGEPLAPLTRVASGGELSRVLLALKGVLALGDRVATYVFDEVDSGVGGAVAEAIGERLLAAARGHQVLCITHLPQIAAFAEAHFRVSKRAQGGRTITEVQRLTEGERVEELARMLGGARVSDTAREHARRLLEEGATARARAVAPPAKGAIAAKRRAKR